MNRLVKKLARYILRNNMANQMDWQQPIRTVEEISEELNNGLTETERFMDSELFSLMGTTITEDKYVSFNLDRGLITVVFRNKKTSEIKLYIAKYLGGHPSKK